MSNGGPATVTGPGLPVGAVVPVQDPFAAAVARPGLRARLTSADQVMNLVAAVLLPLGLVFVLLGWYGASHTPYLFEQVPYLVSGGLLGLGLVLTGGFVLFGSWIARTGREQQAVNLELLAAVLAVRSELVELREQSAEPGRERALDSSTPAEPVLPVAELDEGPRRRTAASSHAASPADREQGSPRPRSVGSGGARRVRPPVTSSNGTGRPSTGPSATGPDRPGSDRIRSNGAAVNGAGSNEVRATGDKVSAARTGQPRRHSASGRDALVATARGSMLHRPDCSVVVNRDDLHAVARDDTTLTPCRMCDPLAATARS